MFEIDSKTAGEAAVQELDFVGDFGSDRRPDEVTETMALILLFMKHTGDLRKCCDKPVRGIPLLAIRGKPPITIPVRMFMW